MTLLSVMFSRKWDHPPLHRYLIERLKLKHLIDLTLLKCYLCIKCISSFSLQSDFPSVNLCAYPFILNAQAKTTMLQTDAELQMQVLAVNVKVVFFSVFSCLITDLGLTMKVLFSSLFSCFFSTSTCDQDGSKRCKLTQCLYAAHTGTPTCEEPLLGAPCAQEPFSK